MITLDAEITELKREIAMRRGVYPRWVADRKLFQADANHRIACLEATLARLEQMKGERAPALPGLGPCALKASA